MKKRKICVITGTRSEYGLLSMLMKSIKDDPNLELSIIATGSHLSPEFGLTYKEIEKDGFHINKKIEMVLSADTPSSIAKSTGLGMIGFADAFKEINPDLVVLLGDRYELLAASFTAIVSKIPICHIHGGESTEGAFDESIRHSITKMSWWHFVAAEEYKKRVIQLGEDPSRVFNVGGLGVDLIKNTELLSKEELSEKTGLKISSKNLLITFHPETMGSQKSKDQFQNLLDVLDEMNDIHLIFTMPNADPDGRAIFKMIESYVSKHSERAIAFTSMGQVNYLSTLQFVDGVVGNSSSGLLEVPSFKTGTVNIGERQNGRLKAESVIDCDPNYHSIKSAIEYLYDEKFKGTLDSVSNPYGNGNATNQILDVLKNKPMPKNIKKEFYNL